MSSVTVYLLCAIATPCAASDEVSSCAAITISFAGTGSPSLDWTVLALFTVGDVYASLCKRGAYAPFTAQRRSRALFWL